MKLNWYLKRHHHDYWSLVEPFRKDGKNQHNKLYYFGRLTDEEVILSDNPPNFLH